MVPLHPAFVHFPLALLPTAVLLASWAVWKEAAWARKATRVLLALGLAGALAAVVTGLFAEHAVEPLVDEETYSAIEQHEIAGLLTTGVFAGLTGWLWWRPSTLTMRTRATWVFLLLAWVGVALVLLTGYLGGELVYTRGVGVQTEASASAGAA